jgi:hypothetical protein
MAQHGKCADWQSKNKLIEHQQPRGNKNGAAERQSSKRLSREFDHSRRLHHGNPRKVNPD